MAKRPIYPLVKIFIAQYYFAPTHLLEIYIIDDHSTDNTANIIQTYTQQYPHLHLLALTGTQTGKKAALAAGIQSSTHHLIVTTDADCTMHQHWLAYITSIYEAQKPKFIAAPVCFYQEENVLEQFQSLDFQRIHFEFLPCVYS